ncbi:MAG: deoxyuridine 5'-triphosphate nucleotidohydrolase [Longicatena sp.]
MEKIAKFHKVSHYQFERAWKDCFPKSTISQIQNIYDDIKLPKRATSGSAGYDFFTPITFVLPPKESIKIPLGIRVEIAEGWVLQLHPRSSLGFKYRLQLDNTTGIIDSDYFASDNEGHIFVKLTNDSNHGKSVNVMVGEGILQGIFLPYGITIDDEASEKRNGGFGSTTQ